MQNKVLQGSKVVGKAFLQFSKMLGEETKEMAKSTEKQIAGESGSENQSQAPDLYNLPGTHTGPVDEGAIRKLDIARAQQLEEEMAQIRRQREQEKLQQEQAEVSRLRQLESQPREVPLTATKPARGRGPGRGGKQKGGLSNVVGKAEKGRNVSQ